MDQELTIYQTPRPNWAPSLVSPRKSQKGTMTTRTWNKTCLPAATVLLDTYKIPLVVVILLARNYSSRITVVLKTPVLAVMK